MANKVGRPRKDAQEKGQVKRVPFGHHKLKLQLSDEDLDSFRRRGWKTRWVNDVGGRLNQAEAGGYKFVEPEEATSLGASAVHSKGGDGIASQVRQVVSKGDTVIHGYLMKVKTKFYDEDQAAKWAAIDASELGLIEGRAGGAEVSEAYKPDGREAVRMRVG